MNVFFIAVAVLAWLVPTSLCVAVYTSFDNKAWAVVFINLILFVWCILGIAVRKQAAKKGGVE